MANICIIGTSGAGKTVFLTVLAKRYEKFIPGQPRLEFLNANTSRYINNAWNKLAREQDWPRTNLPGELTNLKWRLHTDDGGDQNHHITVLDSVGQDIREIYDPKPGQTFTNEQCMLREELEKADVLIVLINPVEAINAQQTGEISDVEIPVKMAIDQALERDHTQIAILLSQHDQVEPMLDTNDDPVESLAECGLHAIHGLAIDEDERIEVFHIASVMDTEPFVEGGKTWLRPKVNFESEGLEDVMDWLVDAVESAPVFVPIIDEPEPTPNPNPDEFQWSEIASYIIPIGVALLILFFLFKALGCGGGEDGGNGFPGERVVIVDCRPCKGTGETGWFFKDKCSPCNGIGKVKVTQKKCIFCEASGRYKNEICFFCNGEGYR